MKEHDFWKSICRSVEKKFADDPSTFYDWPEIQSTMLVHNAPWVSVEWETIRNLPRYSRLLADVTLPDKFRYRGGSTQNTTHHTYSLFKWELHTGKKIEDLEYIVEFGGGYGNMCRLIQNMGFRGQYMIIDLPIFTRLQEYYLRSNGVHMENIIWGQPEDVGSTDLLIGLWSISEIPLEERSKVLSIDRKHHLLAISHEFEEIDNLEAFLVVRDIHPINHIPGNSYIIK